MKKISLIALLFSAILLLENCKKDTIYASANTTSLMIANIKDSIWYTDTVTASITYNAAEKSKTFVCTGFKSNREINFSVKSKNVSSSGSSFPLGSYVADSAKNNAFAYLTPQKDSNGDLVYTANGVVTPGSGTVLVSAIDSVKNQITGTFNFTTLINNYDTSGNIISVTIATITGGGFNAVPFTFKSN